MLFIKKIGSGTPLVLLHGWAFTHEIWQPLESVLSSYFTLYLVDLPGFGHSGWMDWDIFKQQLLSQIPASCVVLGWSLGGLYAMRLAIEAGDRISHLVSVASSPCFEAKPDWPGVQVSRFEQFHSSLQADPEQCIQDFISLQTGRAVEKPVFARSVSGLAPSLDYLTQWDLGSTLRSYTNPATFIFGRRDAIVPAALMRVMQREYPNFSYHMMPQAAHMPFLSHPDQFLSIVTGLI